MSFSSRFCLASPKRRILLKQMGRAVFAEAKTLEPRLRLQYEAHDRGRLCAGHAHGHHEGEHHVHIGDADSCAQRLLHGKTRLLTWLLLTPLQKAYLLVGPMENLTFLSQEVVEVQRSDQVATRLKGYIPKPPSVHGGSL